MGWGKHEETAGKCQDVEANSPDDGPADKPLITAPDSGNKSCFLCTLEMWTLEPDEAGGVMKLHRE